MCTLHSKHLLAHSQWNIIAFLRLQHSTTFLPLPTLSHICNHFNNPENQAHIHTIAKKTILLLWKTRNTVNTTQWWKLLAEVTEILTPIISHLNLPINQCLSHKHTLISTSTPPQFYPQNVSHRPNIKPIHIQSTFYHPYSHSNNTHTPQFDFFPLSSLFYPFPSPHQSVSYLPVRVCPYPYFVLVNQSWYIFVFLLYRFILGIMIKRWSWPPKRGRGGRW